ncbi:hypothetical protein GCM10025789_03360 [Tessaracoccus lubricantis]|uniref:DUF559 domain-containing protein n=2 Tax=Tessaracoccus lubricantis TaxID=545543 RepID=A0ABP9F0H3_9ACTN
MRPRQSLPPPLRRLADDQSGVLTTAQLTDGGLSQDVISRMARDWHRVAQGLYLLDPPSFLGAAWAGVLRGGADAAVGGRAAGFLHGVVRDEPSDVTIWAPREHLGFAVGEWSVRFRRSSRRGRLTPRRTSVEETLLDIADEADENEAVSAVARAFAQKKTTPGRVLATVGKRRAVRHRAVLEELSTAAGRGIESALEWQFHRKVLQAHGLPLPDRQVQREAGRVDGRYEEYGLILELDGKRDHGNWSRDMRRDNANIVDDDSRTLRYGWHNTNDEPCGAATQVATLLRRGGWSEQMQRCPACPAVETQ